MELRDLIQNQCDKMRNEFDMNKEPEKEFFYSNGIHFLVIHRTRTGYALCGLNTSFYVKRRMNDLDVYYESAELIDCIREYERFITLLLMPRKFEKPFDPLGVLF